MCMCAGGDVCRSFDYSNLVGSRRWRYRARNQRSLTEECCSWNGRRFSGRRHNLFARQGSTVCSGVFLFVIFFHSSSLCFLWCALIFIQTRLPPPRPTLLEWLGGKKRRDIEMNDYQYHKNKNNKKNNSKNKWNMTNFEKFISKFEKIGLEGWNSLFVKFWESLLTKFENDALKFERKCAHVEQLMSYRQ